MNKKLFSINIAISLILSVIISFLIVGPYSYTNMCAGEEPCYMGYPTQLFIRIQLTIILFIVILSIIYLAEFMYKKLQKT